MNWIKKNWVWLLMNGLAILPLMSIVILVNVDLSGTGPMLTMELPARMREGGPALMNQKSPLWFPIHATGEWAIRWLTVSLTITPLITLFNWKQKTKYRKLFGLYAFGYAFLHLIFFIADRGVYSVFSEVNLVLGLVATSVMTALAITSSKRSIRRLKKRWKSLHKLVYGAAVFSLLHVALLDKTWLPYATIVLLGFILRIPAIKTSITRFRRTPQTVTA